MPTYETLASQSAATLDGTESLAVQDGGQWKRTTTQAIADLSTIEGVYEVPSGTVNGTNAAFVFSGPPILIFRNGVMERRLGTITGNTFTFDVAPDVGDDIEGLV